MRQLVLDSSFTLAWCFKDEASLLTNTIRDSAAEIVFIVPPIWRCEVSNVLCLAERKGRISLSHVNDFLQHLASLHIQTDDAWESVDLAALIGLSRAHRLTTYDAAYLELAQRYAVPLATLDRELSAAAVAAHVQVL